MSAQNVESWMGGGWIKVWLLIHSIVRKRYKENTDQVDGDYSATKSIQLFFGPSYPPHWAPWGFSVWGTAFLVEFKLSVDNYFWRTIFRSNWPHHIEPQIVYKTCYWLQILYHWMPEVSFKVVKFDDKLFPFTWQWKCADGKSLVLLSLSLSFFLCYQWLKDVIISNSWLLHKNTWINQQIQAGYFADLLCYSLLYSVFGL